jgi:predicted MFS family arabinose efflux permease
LAQNPHPPISFGRLIGTGMVGKLVVDIGAQIFNPFLPVIASGLGISVVTLGQLVGLRSAMGLFAPVSGALADRRGYRLVLRFALLTNAAGFILIGASTASWMTVLGMILAGLGTTAFVPNLQAFVSAQLPYRLLARGLGMIEYSWALTGIVGLSVVGLLMQATSWRVPFFVLAAGMVVMSFVFAAMPSARRSVAPTAAASPDNPAPRRWLSLARAVSFFRLGANARSAYATMLAGALSYFAAVQLMISHGAWLVDQYGLSPALLGLVAFVFGWFDLAASVSVSLFTDRIGKRRSVLIGIVGSLIGYLLLPFLNVTVVLVTLAIAVTRMFFEFNIVSHFPLLSDQVPPQRGKVMTLSAALSLVGATLAGFTGPWLLVNVGVPALAWSSAVAVTAALGIVTAFVREPDERTLELQVQKTHTPE